MQRSREAWTPWGSHKSSARRRGVGTCSPGKKACSESIHVFISCPLNMFTLTYSGGSPSPSLQASRLRPSVGRGREERSPAAWLSLRAAWLFLHKEEALLPEAPTEEPQSRGQRPLLGSLQGSRYRRPASGQAAGQRGTALTRGPPRRPAWQWVRELLSCRKLRNHTHSDHFMCESAQRKASGGR